MSTRPREWTDEAARRAVMDQAVREFNEREGAHGSRYAIRFLGPADLLPLHVLAVLVTETTPFFAAAFRLSREQMAEYWRALLTVLLRDHEAFAAGLEEAGELRAAMLVGTPAFPGLRNTIALLADLLWSLGLAGLCRYLRAIAAYEKVLALEPAERGSTVRGIWFYADPSQQGAGCGSKVMQFVLPLCRRLGFEQIQAAVDAGDMRLNRYYTRFGGRHRKETIMSGFKVVEMVRPLADLGGPAPPPGAGAASGG